MAEWMRGLEGLVDEMNINNNSRHLPAVVVCVRGLFTIPAPFPGLY